MTDWQPIETAPKDATIVIVATKSSYAARPFPWPIKARFVAGEWLGQFTPGEFSPYSPQPTHWKPLEEGPADD